MSDEEDESVSEGFSASEDEWKPSKDARGGESSDDDDSDYDEALAAGTGAGTGATTASGRSSAGGLKKKGDSKQPLSNLKGGASVKKRKPTGQSLRSKLYNKYRPPPKTFSTSPQQNSPSASGSKNAKTPNESDANAHGDGDGSSSDSSGDDHLVNPADLDFGSSFFSTNREKSPAPPQFDCNAGITLSDSGSGSEDNNESSNNEAEDDNAASTKAFDFRGLLENANSLEKTRDVLAKRATATPPTQKVSVASAQMDVNALLALGENQNYANVIEDEQKGTENRRRLNRQPPSLDGPSRLSKTKSTRIKRHTKTRPVSTVITGSAAGGGGDSDDSDFEEVADAELSSDLDDSATTPNISGDLEIHVGVGTMRPTKEQKTQHELEMALKRRLNRDIKERQLLMHKASLMCLLLRSIKYNRLLGDSSLMAQVLKLLPSKNAYPTERGTEVKYLQSFVTWFKTAIKLLSPNLYPNKVASSKKGIIEELLEQIKRKEARSKQDMILIFIVLARGMGMNCRLIVNLQPIPLKPAASDLLTIKLKPDDKNKSGTIKDEKEDDDDEEEDDDDEQDDKIKKSKTKSKANTSSTKTIKTEVVKDVKSKAAATKTKTPVKQIKEDTDDGNRKPTSTSLLSKKLKKEAEPIKPIARLKKLEHKEEPKPEIKPSTSKDAIKPQLSRLKRNAKNEKSSTEDEIKKAKIETQTPPVARRTRQSKKETSMAERIGSPVIPKLVIPSSSKSSDTENIKSTRETRSRSKSPKVFISPTFLAQTSPKDVVVETKLPRTRRQLKSKVNQLGIPQLDGADDVDMPKPKKRPKLEKLNRSHENKSNTSSEIFEPPKPVKKAPILPKSVQNLRKDRRVLSTDDEGTLGKDRTKPTASDMWVEVWSEVEEQWICIDLFKGKLHCVDTIRRNASSNMAYVYAFQDDHSIKDVTARYCTSWTTTVRKARVEKAWLDETVAPYLGRRTKRDIRENEEMRRIHADKPLPKSISEFKDHPLYVLERHLLKFQGIYPADAPTLGFIRGQPVYSRDCVHLLHSRDIWLKSARVVKLGEQPYKIVKARPKWDKLTRTVIKDQPLEIFGYWQTQEYEPPTAENGLVPRNAYGNVELFKACMLPKKTVHMRLPGLMRICKKLNIDCANAVIGFDFHQGACHPMYDGFVVCEEFEEVVTAAWEEDQEEQSRKAQEKYEARVYGNWKKLIRGLLIRERLKKKYNF
ncbi:DNA repair protein complementing XP-C cells homolog isoform X1 [Drosophila willistoni]|uniref:DNA repair protein complementing XP-C cells homolog isoform X1 n=1 Tax=Drosophila willistoni TaxID=7260 RepID=UPI00017D638D|nr:DNA repair protein complementing XP-C cells homolog isoform X1 [Drosophila willistoni]